MGYRVEKNIFDKSVKGRRGITFPELDVDQSEIPAGIQREKSSGLPSVSELEVIRHYTKLSQNNFSVDTHFYPLGSCTMKYNPKVNEFTASLDGFLNIHPYQEDYQVQGALEVIYELQQALAKITGFPAVSLAPSAGAQGEYVGIFVIKKYFEMKGEKRDTVIIPDSAHGTNPASAAMAGYKVKQVKSDSNGLVDVEHLKSLITPEIACIMLTNPNTLGLFERNILTIRDIMKQNGSMLYYDGANLNAIVGNFKPSDMGFDVMHINLHKTFSTPHGGGGPGCGPVCVTEDLREYLPYPSVKKHSEKYVLRGEEIDFETVLSKEHSIGRIRWFYGNFLVILKAYTYFRSLGMEGIRNISEMAVLNANYLKEKLKKFYHLPYDTICMHEFVLSAKQLKQETGISALDIAKRLIDYGIHPPTIYFPLIIPEALMMEPTETETKETLDHFISVMEKIYEECYNDKDKLKNAPHQRSVTRLNEVMAVKEPKLTLK